MTSIFNLVPGLSEKMDSILERYEKYHHETYGGGLVSEDTPVNISPHKDSSETPKKGPRSPVG